MTLGHIPPPSSTPTGHLGGTAFTETCSGKPVFTPCCESHLDQSNLLIRKRRCCFQTTARDLHPWFGTQITELLCGPVPACVQPDQMGCPEPSPGHGVPRWLCRSRGDSSRAVFGHHKWCWAVGCGGAGWGLLSLPLWSREHGWRVGGAGEAALAVWLNSNNSRVSQTPFGEASRAA